MVGLSDPCARPEVHPVRRDLRPSSGGGRTARTPLACRTAASGTGTGPVRRGEADRAAGDGRLGLAHRALPASHHRPGLGLRLVHADRRARLRAHAVLAGRRRPERPRLLPALPGADPGGDHRPAGDQRDRRAADLLGRGGRRGLGHLRRRGAAARTAHGDRDGGAVGAAAPLDRAVHGVHGAGAHRLRRLVAVRGAHPPLAVGGNARDTRRSVAAQRDRGGGGGRGGGGVRTGAGGPRERAGRVAPLGGRGRGPARLVRLCALGRLPQGRCAGRVLRRAARLDLEVRLRGGGAERWCGTSC